MRKKQTKLFVRASILGVVLLAAHLALAPVAIVSANYTATVDPTISYQTFEGWGVSLAWWGNEWGGLPDTNRNAIADAIFDPNKGLGLNVVRYNLGADGPGNVCHNQMRAYGNIPSLEPTAANFDWTKDANQRWMLQAAQARGANYFEAFVNSAPAWMLDNSCTAGATKPAFDNLSSAHYSDFSNYIATVVKHFHDSWGITFRTVDPFNEPDNGYWYSTGTQEGMNVSVSNQNILIKQLASALNANGAASYTSISANDNTNIDGTVTDFNSFDSTTKGNLAQVNTHGYSGSNRAGLYQLGQLYNKRVWMSEWGKDSASSPMASALDLSNRILLDEKQMHPSAWVMWQAAPNDSTTDTPSALWSLVDKDSSHNLSYPPHYWAMAQYSKFIRPGYKMLSINDANSLAAFDPNLGRLTIVTTNNSASDTMVSYDLSRFSTITGGATPFRTSSTENLVQLSTIGLTNKKFSATAKANSITTYIIYGVTAPTASSDFNPAASYTLVNVNSGKVLDVVGASTANGGSIDQWPTNGGTNQQWNIVNVGSGKYKLVNINSSKVLEVAAFSTTNGGTVDEWTDNGGTNQQWTIVSVGTNKYKLVNVNSSKVLEVVSASTADGAVVDQWADNGGTNQQWTIVLN
ncbi:MAG TPA: RICIN domain-containing protein [Chloroflexia bacterium]|nr:RICIN domain-containing protein [Chloroflexia bacterium]